VDLVTVEPQVTMPLANFAAAPQDMNTENVPVAVANPSTKRNTVCPCTRSTVRTERVVVEQHPTQPQSERSSQLAISTPFAFNRRSTVSKLESQLQKRCGPVTVAVTVKMDSPDCPPKNDGLPAVEPVTRPPHDRVPKERLATLTRETELEGVGVGAREACAGRVTDGVGEGDDAREVCVEGRVVDADGVGAGVRPVRKRYVISSELL